MTDKKQKALPMQSTRELSDKEKRNVANYLDSKMIRYAEIKISTISLSDANIAAMMKVPLSDVRKWSKNPYVLEYINQEKKSIFNEDYIESMQRQHQELTEKAYLEYLSRFDQPDMDHYQKLPDIQQKSAYMARFASQAEFKDLARAFVDLSKQTKSILPDNLEGSMQTDMKEVVYVHRQMFEKSRKERLELEKAINEGSVREVDGVASLFLYDGSQDDPQLVIEDNTENQAKETITQEVTLRQVSITHSRKPKVTKEEDDEDD